MSRTVFREKDAYTIAYRVDMEDETGTAFCDACLGDAMDSGLFRVDE